MVSANTKYFATLPALGKSLSILFSMIAIGLGGHAYEKSLYNVFWKFEIRVPTAGIDGFPHLGRETFFLSIVSLFLIFSVISLLCHVLNEELSYTKTNKMVDIGIHGAGALMLIIAGSLVIASANAIDGHCEKLFENFTLLKGQKCQYQGEKIFAGIFTILNSFLFGFITLIGVLRLNNNEAISSTP